MNVTYLYLDYEKTINNEGDFGGLNPLLHNFHKLLIQESDFTISIIQRASFKTEKTVDGVNYHFIADEFSYKLRWWQEPKTSIAVIKNINPTILHVIGLNLPLQFRWIRRRIGNNVKIIGEHTGETIWANRKLWLQQFGLRVVDGFIFASESARDPWARASVILPRQTTYVIPHLHKKNQNTVKSLLAFYSTLIKS